MDYAIYASAVVLLISCVVLVVLLYRGNQARSKAERERADARQSVLKLQEQVESLERTLRSRNAETQSILREEKNRADRANVERQKLLAELAIKERAAEAKLRACEAKERELAEIIVNQQKKLEAIAGISKEDAIKQLTESVRGDVEKEVARLLEKRRQMLNERSEEEAKKIISLAISRYASPHTVETTVSYVDVPNDDFKGKIIGREGRNIRAIERETGVDVIIDDTPGVVSVSAFDGVRREIAKRSLERLVSDGRIHPARIEEVVEKTKRDLEREISKIGEKFLFEHDVHNVNPKLVTLIGRLKFRTSYGQNVLQHVDEVGNISAMMAGELGIDSKLARRCGIFHDIGKAVDHTFEGSHPEIGGYLLKRFNEREEVIEAAAGHHADQTQVKFVTTSIVAAADAISAARPGARGEKGEGYIKRMERIEAIAKSFSGVTSAFCVYAGRELRVLVDSGEVDDGKAAVLAQEIAKTIEDQLTYPGEIKVTLLREKRIIEYAR